MGHRIDTWARQTKHADGITWFLSKLEAEARISPSSEFLWSVPTARSDRGFNWGESAIAPNAVGKLISCGLHVPFYFEYELRARYFSSFTRSLMLDSVRTFSDDKNFKDTVLANVSDPYLSEWWARDFKNWTHQYRAEALAPVQTRLSYYASSKRARAMLGQRRSTIDLRKTIQNRQSQQAAALRSAGDPSDA